MKPCGHQINIHGPVQHNERGVAEAPVFWVFTPFKTFGNENEITVEIVLLDAQGAEEFFVYPVNELTAVVVGQPIRARDGFDNITGDSAVCGVGGIGVPHNFERLCVLLIGRAILPGDRDGRARVGEAYSCIEHVRAENRPGKLPRVTAL